jgi:hypothetical protein
MKKTKPKASLRGRTIISKSVRFTFIPGHPAFPDSPECSLTTKQKVRECIYPAIEVRYNYRPVKDGTKLGAGGIGLDDQMIRTDLYATIVIAVHGSGCTLRTFSPDIIAKCKTAGDITNAIWEDLSAP